MTTSASEVYEIVVEDASGGPKSRFQLAFASVVAMLTRRSAQHDLDGVFISVRRKDSGDEVFRHIEDAGDDEDHLLTDIERDLASMSQADFEAAWVN